MVTSMAVACAIVSFATCNKADSDPANVRRFVEALSQPGAVQFPTARHTTCCKQAERNTKNLYLGLL